jgi:cobalamin biosynthesis protein CobD/CbiB
MEQASDREESRVGDVQIQRPVKTRRHIGQAISLKGLRSDVQRADGINAKIAVFLTNLVGSMWCAYVFAIIAFIGLPAALRPGGEGIIAWIAQTFLQLVLLSVIMVGQNVQSIASDLRSQHTYDDAVLILDRLDVHTQGGIKDLADRIDHLEATLRR